MRKWVKEKFDSPFDMFEQFDVTNDGQLSYVEFGNAVRKNGFEVPDSMLHVLFEGLDIDGAGLLSEDEVILLEEDADERTRLKILVKRKREEEKLKLMSDLAEFHDMMTNKNLKAAHRLAPRAWHHEILAVPGVHMKERQARQHQVMQ